MFAHGFKREIIPAFAQNLRAKGPQKSFIPLIVLAETEAQRWLKKKIMNSPS